MLRGGRACRTVARDAPLYIRVGDCIADELRIRRGSSASGGRLVGTYAISPQGTDTYGLSGVCCAKAGSGDYV